MPLLPIKTPPDVGCFHQHISTMLIIFAILSHFKLHSACIFFKASPLFMTEMLICYPLWNGEEAEEPLWKQRWWKRAILATALMFIKDVQHKTCQRSRCSHGRLPGPAVVPTWSNPCCAQKPTAWAAEKDWKPSQTGSDVTTRLSTASKWGRKATDSILALPR